MQSVMAFAGGAYLSSNLPFTDKSGKIDLVKNPLWWQRSIKGAGILVFGLGAYRAGEAIQLLWKKYRD